MNSTINKINKITKRLIMTEMKDDEWKKFLFDYKAAELSQTTTALFRKLMNEGYASLDLSGLSADTVNGMHLAVILRATATKQREVKGWGEALDIAKPALIAQGVSWTDALAGLYKY
jgi:hypothetical protein